MAKKLSKQINQQYLPTIVGGYPVYANGGKMQYGFGSWLKDNWTATLSPITAIGGALTGKSANEFTQANAGTIGTIGGAALGSMVGMPALGASIGGQLGGQVQGNYEQDQANQAQQLQQQQLFNQQMSTNLPATPQYIPTFAMGGKMYQDDGSTMDKKRESLFFHPVQLLNKRLYNTIDAGGGYSDNLSEIAKQIKNVLLKPDNIAKSTADQEIFGYSLGQINLKDMKNWEQSPHTPSKSIHKKQRYIRPTRYLPQTKEILLDYIDKAMVNKNKKLGLYNLPLENSIDPLANYTFSVGEDNKGKFYSIYDKWDFKNPIANIFLRRKPEIYDKVYYKNNPEYGKPHPKVQELAQGEEELERLQNLRKDYLRGNKNMYNEKGEYTKEFLKDNKALITIRDSVNTLRKEIERYAPSKYVINKDIKAYGGKINPSEIAKGIKEEMEHTTSKKESKKIAKEHLMEHPDYYTKLKKAGLADSYAKGGGIKIDPAKRGTFKAQASKMDMSVQEAASKILAAKEGTYTPAMRKKATFAKNFAKADGGTIDMFNSYMDIPASERLVEFKNGGSHEQNINGGIKVGQNALTEEGEFLYTTKDGTKYVFSDRF